MWFILLKQMMNNATIRVPRNIGKRLKDDGKMPLCNAACALVNNLKENNKEIPDWLIRDQKQMKENNNEKLPNILSRTNIWTGL